MARALSDALGWAAAGTELFLTEVEALTRADYEAPSLLPGWNRKYLVAHVAANAEALGNLAHWAATGEATPMYASPEARVAGIERGAQLPAADLTGWLAAATAELATALDGLTDEQWQAEVLTAQGRSVPATEVPWMRSREVYVHWVDLGRGGTFADLPEPFLAELVADVLGKRGMAAAELPAGPLPEVAAWLAGRPHHLRDAPELGPWL